ncbi:hypothetical protein PG985_008302 [Apiospora marii]|uniref:uncharacterized protein n=1 Tax=Apiospora marii TaxID=335849 RepID=UPI00312DBE6B
MDSPALRDKQKMLDDIVAQNINARFKIGQLCWRCRYVLFWPTLKILKRRRHYSTYNKLVGSAFSGCHICSLLLENLEGFQTPFYVKILNQRSLFKSMLEELGSGKYLHRYTIKIEPHNGLISLYPVDVMAISSIYIEAMSSISTASDATFKLAHQWIRQCILGHDTCNTLEDTSCSLPTRLLDLQKVCVSDRHGHVQLRATQTVLSDGNATNVTYVTLSHRWGDVMPLRLLQGPDPGRTVEYLETGVSLGELPPTFRDAVIIAKRLGFEYLWIDSLCIVQDSVTDWTRESSIMGDIYRGSAFTIAALGATDSNGGCFATRNPLFYASCYLQKINQMYLRHENRDFHLAGELLKRGWVAQERILTPRTLFYGKFGIAWECKELQSTAEGPDGFGGNPKSDFARLTSPFDDDLDLSNPSKTTTEFYKAWTDLIQSYSKTKLTKREDKLAALQGLIHRISQSAHLTPVAGLWKEFLPVELLWYTSKDYRETRPPSTIAPSWSWASVDTPRLTVIGESKGH